MLLLVYIQCVNIYTRYVLVMPKEIQLNSLPVIICTPKINLQYGVVVTCGLYSTCHGRSLRMRLTKDTLMQTRLVCYHGSYTEHKLTHIFKAGMKYKPVK